MSGDLPGREEQSAAGAEGLLYECGGRRESALVLDPSGELYRRTARSFDNALRVDLEAGELPRWNPAADCGRREYGAAFAKRMAAVICSGALPEADAEYRQSTQGGDSAEMETGRRASALFMLASLLAEGGELFGDLKLPEIHAALQKCFIEMAPPASLPLRHLQLLGIVGRKDGRWKVFYGNDAGQLVFKRAVRDVIHFLTPFLQPRAVAFWDESSATDRLDFRRLRETSTAIYITPPVGQPESYAPVLSALVGHAMYELKRTGIKQKNKGVVTPVLAILPKEDSYRESIAEAMPVGRLIRVSFVVGDLGEQAAGAGAGGGLMARMPDVN